MDCIFCKIAKGEIDSAKIWEDDKFIAILDLNPNTKGMTLVMPKPHFDSDTFLMPEKDYLDLMLASKKVAEILKKGLNVNRVAMVAEGMGINHVHVKLYPLHGVGEKFEEILAPTPKFGVGVKAKEKVFFEKYQGYISTQLGPQANIEELKKLADEVKPLLNF